MMELLRLTPAQLDRIEVVLLKLGSMVTLKRGREVYVEDTLDDPETVRAIKKTWNSLISSFRIFGSITYPRSPYSLATLQEMVKIARELTIVNEGLGTKLGSGKHTKTKYHSFYYVTFDSSNDYKQVA